MPKLPGYDSSRQLTTQQPSFLKGGGGPSTTTEIIAKGVKAVSDVAIKWSNALDTIQYTTAKANYETGRLDILNRAANDPEYTNSDLYVKELDTLKKNSLKGFANPAVQSRAALDFDYGNEAARIEIGNMYKKKSLEAGQVAAFRLIELEKSNYVNAPTDEAKIVSAAKIKSIIDAQVKAGVFGTKEGYKLYNDAMKDAQSSIKDAEGLRRKQEKEIMLAREEAENEREDNMVQMRINMADAEGNPLDATELVDMARDAMNNEEISPRFAQVYINSLKTVKVAKPSKLENIKKFNELTFKNKALHDKEWAWRDASFPDRAKFRADVLEAYNDGQITEKQRDVFLKDHTKKFYRDPKVRNAIAQVTAQASLYGTPEAKATAEAEMHFDLINKIIDGKNPDDALNEVITERMIKELGGEAEKDEYGFVIGEERSGHKYIGNNKWQKL